MAEKVFRFGKTEPEKRVEFRWDANTEELTVWVGEHHIDELNFKETKEFEDFISHARFNMKDQ